MRGAGLNSVNGCGAAPRDEGLARGTCRLVQLTQGRPVTSSGSSTARQAVPGRRWRAKKGGSRCGHGWSVSAPGWLAGCWSWSRGCTSPVSRRRGFLQRALGTLPACTAVQKPISEGRLRTDLSHLGGALALSEADLQKRLTSTACAHDGSACVYASRSAASTLPRSASAICFRLSISQRPAGPGGVSVL
jgi:hypothetical protein